MKEEKKKDWEAFTDALDATFDADPDEFAKRVKKYKERAKKAEKSFEKLRKGV